VLPLAALPPAVRIPRVAVVPMEELLLLLLRTMPPISRLRIFVAALKVTSSVAAAPRRSAPVTLFAALRLVVAARLVIFPLAKVVA